MSGIQLDIQTASRIVNRHNSYYPVYVETPPFHCKCPFHADNTPSAHVYADNGLHCFTCNRTWTPFQYLRQALQLSTIAAEKLLAHEGIQYVSNEPLKIAFGSDNTTQTLLLWGQSPAYKKQYAFIDALLLSELQGNTIPVTLLEKVKLT